MLKPSSAPLGKLKREITFLMVASLLVKVSGLYRGSKDSGRGGQDGWKGLALPCAFGMAKFAPSR